MPFNNVTDILANFPESVVEELPGDFSCGVYLGLAQVDNGPVYKMVMSIGWNPQYDNEKKSMVRLPYNGTHTHLPV